MKKVLTPILNYPILIVMVVRTVLNGFTVELDVELNNNQEPQAKKERSLERTDSDSGDYELSIYDIDPTHRSDYSDSNYYADTNSSCISRL